MRPIIGKIIRRGTENSDLNPDLCAVTDPARRQKWKWLLDEVVSDQELISNLPNQSNKH